MIRVRSELSDVVAESDGAFVSRAFVVFSSGENWCKQMLFARDVSLLCSWFCSVGV